MRVDEAGFQDFTPLTFAIAVLALGLTACGDDDMPRAARGVVERTLETENSAGGTMPVEWTFGEWPSGGAPTATLGANQPPTIRGVPSKSVLAGATFNFRPSASDAEGDTLTFSVVNRPPWAAFNTRTGRLSGAPGVADVGRYANILISVTDGHGSATLASFAIDVVATALGTITLSWVPPTEREDGSALSELGGYKIYWGKAKDDYPDSVRIDNPGVTTYVIEGLLPATYFLVATTIDRDGLESDFSKPARITVN